MAVPLEQLLADSKRLVARDAAIGEATAKLNLSSESHRHQSFPA
jgi:hypothetical protein